MNAVEISRLLDEALGGPWQVAMCQIDGVTHYQIRQHDRASVAIDPRGYWAEGYIPSADEDGYYQPDDKMDCDKWRVATARLIAHLPEIARAAVSLQTEVDDADCVAIRLSGTQHSSALVCSQIIEALQLILLAECLADAQAIARVEIDAMLAAREATHV